MIRFVMRILAGLRDRTDGEWGHAGYKTEVRDALSVRDMDLQSVGK